MIYPQHTFETKIGFDAVRAMVAAECWSALGRAQVERMRFASDHKLVAMLLEQTAEMVALRAETGGLPLSGVVDLSAELAMIRAQGSLMPAPEVLKLRNMLMAMSDVHRALSSASDTAPYPRLRALAASMALFPQLVRTIDGIVHPGGDVLDSASPELHQIRRELGRMGSVISNTMRRVMARAAAEGYLEADVQPSIRDGRLVIPVEPMHKRKIPGIVHDESASGKTFYIEPAEVVEANNRLRELQLEERHEIARILIALADEIRPHIEDIKASMGTLGIFDFINAKAKLAGAWGCNMPQLHAHPQLEWYGARHPGLQLALERQGKAIVPINITLTAEQRLLLISGPNAGGKSVVLKTVAINQYMLQCGMLPAVHDNSHFGIFDDIMVDIGDDQSLDDDLSTYSSHLKNMRFLLQHAGPRGLALLDEPGSGTEPQIGAAIAQAIIGDLCKKGLWGVVTTHFHSLKRFADDTPGMANGSMLYDRGRMQPLFSLQIGHPGSSFAVEIARKIGLPAEIIDNAEQIVGTDYVNMDKYLLDITRDKQYWQRKRDEIRRLERQADEAREKLQQQADQLRQERRAIIDDARQQAEKIIDQSNSAVERTIREIRTAQADSRRTAEAREQLRQERIALNHDLSEKIAEPATLARAPKSKKKASPKQPQQALEVGMTVLLDGKGIPGTILTIDAGAKTATVAFGNLKTQAKLDRLHPTLKKPNSGATTTPRLLTVASDQQRQRQLDLATEIDVRGMRVDEAVQAVTYYIDDAIQFRMARVRILHGTGTGALRQAIRQYLRTIPGVISARDEDVRLGGAGITVVELA